MSRVCLSLYVALSGFVYPLSGFLLHGPGDPVSGPSVLGVLPCRVLFPLLSWTPFQGLCSPALFLSASGLDRKTARTPELCSQQRACLTSPAFTPTTESLLSWGSPSLGLCSLDPVDRSQLLFCAFNPHLTVPVRRSRVFLPKTRHDFKKKSANPSDVLASSTFQAVWHDQQRGFIVSPNETRCITTLSPSFLALPKRAC